MAKAALAAGLVDRVGDCSDFEARSSSSSAARPQAARSRIRASGLLLTLRRRPIVGPRAPIGVARGLRHDRRRQGRRRQRRRRHHRQEIQDGIRNKGIKALVVRVDSPGGSVLASERIRQALLEAKSKKIPVVVSMEALPHRVAIDRDAGELHLRGAFDHHRFDRRVRGPAELPGTLAEAGHRGRRAEDHAAVRRARSAQGPSPEVNELIQTGVESMYACGSSTSSRHRGTRRRPISTELRRGASGTAERRCDSRSAWSTASAEWTKRIAKAARTAREARR